VFGDATLGNYSGMFFFCDRCGTRLHSFELSPGRHECDPVRLIEFQVRRARFEIDESLEARVAEWERDPRVARRVAFART